MRHRFRRVSAKTARNIPRHPDRGGKLYPEKAEKILAAGYADLIAFGRPFIANPDLPQRLAHHWPLNDVSDPATLFGGTAVGYTDYPTYNLCEENDDP